MSQLLTGRSGPADAQPLRLANAVPLMLSVLLVSAAYYVGGLAGILLGFPPSGISAIWPSTAILLAALLLTPPRHWWLYLLAVVPTHLHLVANFQRPDVPFVVMFCQVASNEVHAVLAAVAVRVVIGAPPRFDSFRNMAAYILLAAVATTAVACVLAVWLFLLTGWTTDFWLAWRQRVLAHVFPIITIPPLILLTIAGQALGARHVRRRDYAELGLLTIGLLAVGVLVFGWTSTEAPNVPALLLAPLPFLLWAAVRLGIGGLSLSLLIVAGISLSSGFVGIGPFATQSPAENVLSLQIFLIAISIPLMLLAALVEERRRAEGSLKQSEERMALAATSANIGLWQFDNTSGHFWATEHCRSMFGLPRHAPLTPEVLIDAARPEDRQAAKEALRKELPADSEFRVVLPDGQTRWIFASGDTRFDEKGKLIRASGVFADITARKRAEDEVRATQSELARVARLTTMGQMAASIAHEINQPLAAIATNGSAGLRWLANATPNVDEARAALTRIVNDSHRAGQVIGSIRAMSEKGSQQKAWLDINEVISEVLALVDGELKSKRVSVCTELFDGLPQVFAERILLQQVILNLIINASDAMTSISDRPRVLQVRAKTYEPAGVLIIVEDSGTGIDPKDIDRIFEPFFTTKSHGLGIGLSICRSIIEAHGGRLSASSAHPHGTVFQVVLPTGGPGGE